MARRTFTALHKRQVGARQGWACAACGATLEASFHVDHVRPLWDGGADDLDNAQALCVPCHNQKTIEEEMTRLQRRSAARTPATLQCSRCFRVVSPYFVHKCT
jgi:5-methylcytosine-specific restriction protein A